MITDDPGTPGDGHWEINTALTAERRTGEHRTEMPLLDLNYGVGERVQLKYEAAWVRLHDDDGRHDGLSNSLAGVKWRFYDAGEKAWQISMYPQVEFANPGSHSDRRDLASHGTSCLLPFQLMKEFESFSFNADFGYVLHGADEDEWFGGLALGKEVKAGVELAVELHWEAESHFRGTALTANVGARIDLSENHTLLVSVGRELHHADEARASLIAYLGLQVRR